MRETVKIDGWWEPTLASPQGMCTNWGHGWHWGRPHSWPYGLACGRPGPAVQPVSMPPVVQASMPVCPPTPPLPPPAHAPHPPVCCVPIRPPGAAAEQARLEPQVSGAVQAPGVGPVCPWGGGGEVEGSRGQVLLGRGRCAPHTHTGTYTHMRMHMHTHVRCTCLCPVPIHPRAPSAP